MSLRSVLLAFAAIVVASAASSAFAAEGYAHLLNGEKYQGDLPGDVDVRLAFDVARGAEPRLTFSMSYTGATVTFTETHLFGPDGKEILFSPDLLSLSFPKTGVSNLSFKGYTAQAAGTFELLVKTNSHHLSHVSGRFTTARPAKIPFAGDETSDSTINPVTVSLLAGDGVQIIVAKAAKTGTAPKIVHYAWPTGSTAIGDTVQKETKKGSTYHVFGLATGDYAFTIGYQGTPAAGAWKGTLKITSLVIRGGFPVQLRLRNSPGVPLTVFDNDATLTPTWGGTHVGVATDGNSILVTSENAGVLYGELYDTQLQTIPGTFSPTALAGPADVGATETLSGHKLMFMGGSYYAAFATASGKGLSLLQLSPALQRAASSQVLATSADSTQDFFLAGDSAHVSLGVAHPATKGHTVYVLDATNFGNRSTYSIGGATLPQSAASGAAWRGATEGVYELWSADTQNYHGPSDLHRVLYSSTWTATTADATPVQDPTATEETPTAVTVDATTHATVLHYVVPDDPPMGGAPAGSGRIHRRVFDAAGLEIAGQHVVLPRASCNRPTATILGAFLYLGYETASGFVVERYELLR